MNNHDIEALLPSWFEGTLSREQREKVEKWKEASEENRQLFTDSFRAWEELEQLRLMKKYDAEKALHQVNSKIKKHSGINIWTFFQKVAAILVIPLLLTTLYFAHKRSSTPVPAESFVAWHTLETPAGMRSEFILPDSTKVHMNSRTRLSYPLSFNGDIREVRLLGQAYFEVTRNQEAPFIVNTGKVNIEVTGTEFIASNYPHEHLSEIVLVEGGISLFQGDFTQSKKTITRMIPGQRAILKAGDNRLITSTVDVQKYRAWKEGILMFRDDPMPEVVLRLNRWFNVDIKLTGPELKDYVYTATFEDESLSQVLELLKISAPIDYSIKQRKRKADETFSKMEIEIKQR